MDAINIFLDKEIEDKLFNRKVNDIYYWEFLRALASCDVNSKVNNSSPMFSKSKFTFRKYLISIKRIKKYLKFKKSDILLVSHPRRIKKDNKYFNPYIDPYYDILTKKYSVQLIEEPTWSYFGSINSAHQFPLYNENIYLTDLYEIKLIFIRKLYPIIHRKKYKNILKEYDSLIKIISNWYNINTIDFKDFFIESLIRINFDRKYVNKMLRKIQPKIVMIHYMPSIFKQVIFEQCKVNNIKSVEIQHGTITKVDPLINKIKDVSLIKHNSDYIFSFGENQISNYLINIKNKKNIIPVGLPYFENILKDNHKYEKKYVLLISQSTIGREMAEFAFRLSELFIKNNINYKIVFKYHPNELSNTYSILNNDNIIQIKSEKTIYDIQKESIIQIGSYSTSLYEGFALKVPTFVLTSFLGSIEAIDIFEGINQGVYFIENEKDILKFIKKNDIMPLDKDINKLWTKDSEYNILSSVNKIMEDK